MRTILCWSLLLGLAVGLRAADFDPFAGPKPLIMFLRSNAWGDAGPRVVIYENGEAVFLKAAGGDASYRHVTLDAAALAAVRQRLQAVLGFPTLKTRYDLAPGVSDQPEGLFYLRDGSREIAVNVYGLGEPGRPSPAWASRPGRPASKPPPDELLRLHEWLCAFDTPGSEEWKPAYIEVRLLEYPSARGPGVPWPEDWPAPDSDRAIKRGLQLSIFLDGAMQPQITKFEERCQEKGGVTTFGGKKWDIDDREAFAGESLWRAAFDRERRE